jgi:hypothetical protein
VRTPLNGTPATRKSDPDVDHCSRCGRPATERRLYLLGDVPRCLTCTLRQRSLLRRSGLTALVVGSVLTAINQGTLIVAGDVPRSLLWKVPLTYLVPFCVSTWGALVNARLSRTNR